MCTYIKCAQPADILINIYVHMQTVDVVCIICTYFFQLQTDISDVFGNFWISIKISIKFCEFEQCLTLKCYVEKVLTLLDPAGLKRSNQDL